MCRLRDAFLTAVSLVCLTCVGCRTEGGRPFGAGIESSRNGSQDAAAGRSPPCVRVTLSPRILSIRSDFPERV